MSRLSNFRKIFTLASAFTLSLAGCSTGEISSGEEISSSDDISSVVDSPIEESTVEEEPIAELDLLEENLVDDNYDNFYEIFVYSFCDSDGDGHGDLNGVTSKLSYLRDMGYTGIWLMPIHPSSTYHKYNVDDYYDIDDTYGTLDDFDALIAEAHSLGIKVILDLVVNHCSSNNTWFRKSANAHLSGDTSNEYYDWFNFSTTSQSGYNLYTGSLGSIYYESQFDSSMPDFNLDCNGVREEIGNIVEFWTDRGADGFRLDACTSYYTGDVSANHDFCNWISTTIKSYNEDAFIIGEVLENSTSIISGYAEAAPDMSFFSFMTSTNNAESCYAVRCLNSSSAAQTYFQYAGNVISTAAGGIPAPVLDNHDMNRICGLVGRVEEKVKFVYGLNSMFNGTTFTYYGDEIGMIGSGSDPNRRISMNWGNGVETTINPSGTTSSSYAFDGVYEQQRDENSIINYYKQINNLRNAFPEIARGSISRTDTGIAKVLAMDKTYNDSTITIVINFDTAEQSIDGDYGTLVKGISAYDDGVVTQDGTALTLSGYSIAILQ